MKHTLPRQMQAGRHPVHIKLWLSEDEGFAFDQLVCDHNFGRCPHPSLQARLLYDLLRNHVLTGAGRIPALACDPGTSWLAIVLTAEGQRHV